MIIIKGESLSFYFHTIFINGHNNLKIINLNYIKIKIFL